MRVTNKSLVRTFLSDLNNNLNNMRKYQEQLSSGKEIRRPSDNPAGAVKAMRFTSSINRNDQYLKNIENASAWLDTTDTALGQMTDSLQRIRELTIAASNGTNSTSEYDAYKAEIVQRIEEIAQQGNTTFDGRYIFAGSMTTTTPFKTDMATANLFVSSGDDGKIRSEISPNVDVEINVTGSELLNGKDANGNPLNLGATLKKIVDTLNGASGTSMSDLSGDVLKGVQDNIDNVLRLRAEVGAKANRMETAKSKNEEETYNMTEVLSKTADVDIAEKTMEYSVMQSVYQASLMTGAKIIQPSLIDFLR
jgi:flagellar hook-associated protein 3 FlgL